MLNYVEYPSSVKEGTETPGAFDQNGQRFYVLDRLQEQVSRIRYLLDTTVFFRNQLETCQAAGNAEAAQSAYLSLSSGRIGIANGVRSLKPLLLELEHPAASICEALVNQISSFELMTRDYSKFSGGISRFLDALPSYHTVDASTIGRLMNHVKLRRRYRCEDCAATGEEVLHWTCVGHTNVHTADGEPFSPSGSEA